MSKIQTASGIMFDVLNPNIEDIEIYDIAHALCMIPRFGGHTKRFYSVGLHSILVSTYIWKHTNDPELALWGLLHDAPEAYLGDMVSPLKNLMPEYQKAEDNLMKMIALKFGLLELEIPKEVKEVDARILHNEAKKLLPNNITWWKDIIPLKNLLIGYDFPLKYAPKFIENFQLFLFEIILREDEKRTK